MCPPGSWFMPRRHWCPVPRFSSTQTGGRGLGAWGGGGSLGLAGELSSARTPPVEESTLSDDSTPPSSSPKIPSGPRQETKCSYPYHTLSQSSDEVSKP